MNSLKFEYRENGIILRILSADDAEKVLQFYEKNKNTFSSYETEKPEGFYTTEFQETLLHAEMESFLKGVHVRYFLFDERFPDDIIGSISFFNIRHGHFEQCTTGYKIDEEYRRLGYGTKMLSLATHIITQDFGIHRIEAYIMPSNIPSVHLAERCGYEAEGIAKGYVRLHGKWTDHLRYVYIV
ncbi:MAG: GNAT family N-acetyltransferase [Bacteroides sp.]